ncbi:MAG: aldehyde dehydrogenase family protein, partial [Spongiibacteraceae bacterium]|nr:aldehyde dehydrogenase family protein [Spongiibacteraceae bacterium]
EEIFGPVLSIFTFRDESEAIKIANNSRFGLAAYAATENIARVQRLGQSLNVGLLKIIGSSDFVERDVQMSIEPHKQSGFGFEGGLQGLAAYTSSMAVKVLA